MIAQKNETKNRHFVRVRFSDGGEIKTEINGTVEEVRAYYLNKFFELDEAKGAVKAVAVEFLN